MGARSAGPHAGTGAGLPAANVPGSDAPGLLRPARHQRPGGAALRRAAAVGRQILRCARRGGRAVGAGPGRRRGHGGDEASRCHRRRGEPADRPVFVDAEGGRPGGGRCGVAGVSDRPHPGQHRRGCGATRLATAGGHFGFVAGADARTYRRAGVPPPRRWRRRNVGPPGRGAARSWRTRRPRRRRRAGGTSRSPPSATTRRRESVRSSGTTCR